MAPLLTITTANGVTTVALIEAKGADGATPHEVAQALALDIGQVRPVCCRLHQQGQVHRAARTRPTPHGRPSHVYVGLAYWTAADTEVVSTPHRGVGQEVMPPTMPPLVDSFRGAYHFLSNFDDDGEPVRVDLGDGTRIWGPTAEHVFQALKTLDPEERQRILAADGPARARRLGRLCTMRAGWEAREDGRAPLRLLAMLRVVRAKFAVPRRGQRLLATGDAELVEGNTHGDASAHRVAREGGGVSIEITIICDGCGVVGAGGRTAKRARQDTRANGWKHLPGGKDYCPCCVPVYPDPTTPGAWTFTRPRRSVVVIGTAQLDADAVDMACDAMATLAAMGWAPCA